MKGRPGEKRAAEGTLHSGINHTGLAHPHCTGAVSTHSLVPESLTLINILSGAGQGLKTTLIEVPCALGPARAEPQCTLMLSAAASPRRPSRARGWSTAELLLLKYFQSPDLYVEHFQPRKQQQSLFDPGPYKDI